MKLMPAPARVPLRPVLSLFLPLTWVLLDLAPAWPRAAAGGPGPARPSRRLRFSALADPACRPGSGSLTAWACRPWHCKLHLDLVAARLSLEHECCSSLNVQDPTWMSYVTLNTKLEMPIFYLWYIHFFKILYNNFHNKIRKYLHSTML